MPNTIEPNSNDPETLEENQTTPAAHFYRVVWRWHFYAGLFVIPFMVILSVTGIIYLFKPQLDALMYRDLMFVPPQSEQLNPTAQVEAVRRTKPGAAILRFRPSRAADRSSEVTVETAENRDLIVFVNPYTNEILGEVDQKNNLQYYAEELHGNLMIGSVGSYLVELAACWGLVLIVSGLYLWFPRKVTLVWGVILPRIHFKNKRLFWRDLHAVAGFYGALVIAFMIVTGLPWAEFWGTNFAHVWDMYPAGVQKGAPSSIVPAASLNLTDSQRIVPWAVEEMPMPQSDAAHANHGHHQMTQDDSPQKTTADKISLETVILLAQENNVPSGWTISLPQSATGVYSIVAPTDDPAKETTVHLDQYTGKVLTDARWADYGIVPKAVELGISLHEGLYFGWLNQLLMLFAALVVILLAASGTIMWWQRRPSKRLGAPPMPANFPLWKGAVVIIVVMGIVFPLVGISLILVLLLDYLVLQRIPKLKALFG